MRTSRSRRGTRDAGVTPCPDGESTEVDLGDDTVTNGDGVLLDGQTLYAVRYRSDLVVEVGSLADSAVIKPGAPVYNNPMAVDETRDELHD